MTSSYKDVYDNVASTSGKKSATEAPSQILGNTSSTAMKKTRRLWPRDTKMTTTMMIMMMMMHSAFIVKNDRQEGG